MPTKIIFNNGSLFEVISGSLSLNFDGGVSKCSMTYLSKKAASGAFSSLIGMQSNSNPFNFSGKVIGHSISVKSGENTETVTMVDGSYKLDQKNIVLHRRTSAPGTNGGSQIRKIMRRILKTHVSYHPLSISFEWVDTTLDVVGSASGGCSFGGGNITVLGDEDYNSNPCSIPSASYSIAEGLMTVCGNGIGAHSIGSMGSMRVAYEGTYRSVLSSLCNDLGKRWRWNPFSNVLEILDTSSPSTGVPGFMEGCDIISYTLGETLEGTFSQSSITYWSDEPFSTVTPTKTVDGWDSSIVNFQLPGGHSISDLVTDLLYSAVSPLKTHDLMVAERWEDLGYKVISKVSFHFTDEDWCSTLREKFNIMDDIEISKALAYSMGLESFPAEFLIIQQYPDGPKSYEKKRSEEMKYGTAADSYLYYPCSFYNKVSYGSSESYFKKNTVTIDPEPQLVLKNGNLLRGYFESVDVATYGDTDATEFSDAVSNCVKSIGGDIFNAAIEYIIENSVNNIMTVSSGPNVFVEDPETKKANKVRELYANPDEAKIEMLASLPSDIRTLYEWVNVYGASINVYTPPKEITVNAGGTRQDVRELSIQLQDVKLQTITGLDGKKFKDICKNAEEAAFEKAEADSLSEEETKPKDRPPTGKVYSMIPTDIPYGSAKDGGVSEQGDIYTITCGDKSIMVRIGGLLPYRFLINYSLEYSTAMSAGKESPSYKYSIARASGGLEQTVLLTDISGDSYNDMDDNIISGYSAGAVSFPGPVKMASFETTRFSMPITNSIRSISASFSGGQLRVSYEYQTFPPKPPKIAYTRRVAKQTQAK